MTLLAKAFDLPGVVAGAAPPPSAAATHRPSATPTVPR
jgi:hypothetical protein